jgi:hypothetical protein
VTLRVVKSSSSSPARCRKSRVVVTRAGAREALALRCISEGVFA